jgi:MFS family permease
MIAQSLFVFVSVMAALSLGPINSLLAADFKLDGTQTAMLTGACVLALGYSNFIIVPCSNIFGRRVTSLVFSVMAVGFTAWEASAKTHGSFLAARIMTGVATATNESIMVQAIADLFFVHQRGRAMGVYLFVMSVILDLVSD